MKKLLIVIDYQNDFVTGSLGFPKAAALEQRIAAKIQQYRARGDEIVFTLDTHNDRYLDTQEGHCLPVAHCLEGTDGWKLFGSVAGLRIGDDHCFIKHSFGSPDLFRYLCTKTYESIELVGVVSNICVISNAILAKTALPEVPVIVDAACVASNDDCLNKEALHVMESLQIHVTGRE